MNSITLEMRSVTKRFPGVLALDKVNLTVYKGEMHAICGENGAGKSTLMKVLSGAYPHRSIEGDIYIENVPCRFEGPLDAQQAGIAMIYQEVNMHLNLTVAENLLINQWQGGKHFVNWRKMRQEAQKHLNRIGLKLDPEMSLAKLSVSEQQLVSIARALSHNPKILILDEPTSPLTEHESERLFQVLLKLKSEGIACILISHKMDEVFRYADRIDVMRDGKSISSHPIAETDEKRVVTEMVGRSIDSYFPERTNATGDILLEVKNITVPHPYITKRNIVNNISFHVRRGEILGLAGLVGAGRSETVNAIFGKTSLTAGEIYLENSKITIRKPWDAIRHGMALVTEDRKADGFVPLMGIRENITLASMKEYSQYGFFRRKAERQAAEKMFNRLRVRAPGLEFPVNNLSGGNQQKVVLCKWLIRKTKLLIMDEPTRGIDVGAKGEIYKIMAELAAQGVSIILISSELPELVSMSDRVYVLAGGSIRRELTGADINQEKIMQVITMESEAG